MTANYPHEENGPKERRESRPRKLSKMNLIRIYARKFKIPRKHRKLRKIRTTQLGSNPASPIYQLLEQNLS